MQIFMLSTLFIFIAAVLVETRDVPAKPSAVKLLGLERLPDDALRSIMEYMPSLAGAVSKSLHGIDGTLLKRVRSLLPKYANQIETLLLRESDKCNVDLVPELLAYLKTTAVETKSRMLTRAVGSGCDKLVTELLKRGADVDLHSWPDFGADLNIVSFAIVMDHAAIASKLFDLVYPDGPPRVQLSTSDAIVHDFLANQTRSFAERLSYLEDPVYGGELHPFVHDTTSPPLDSYIEAKYAIAKYLPAHAGTAAWQQRFRDSLNLESFETASMLIDAAPAFLDGLAHFSGGNEQTVKALVANGWHRSS